MGDRPVTAPSGAGGGSWKLAEPFAAQAQGMIVSGYDHLPFGAILMLEFAWDESQRGGRWLEVLREKAPVTPADGKRTPAVNLALSWTGLARMGLDPATLAEFPTPFREGMFQIDRLRRLHDRIAGEWSQCVIEGGPLWSANTPQAKAVLRAGETALVKADAVETPFTVHAVLMLFTAGAEDAARLTQDITAALAPVGVKVVRQRDMTLHHDDAGLVREHFGFADGVSQPIPWDAQAIRPATPAIDPCNGIALGDILLGHVDGHNEIARGPFVARSPAEEAARPTALRTDLHDAFDLCANGSFLVVRELAQNVAGFWQAMEAAAARLGDPGPAREPIDADWLAERVVGRAFSGDVLRPGGILPRRDPATPDNDFGYYDEDPAGLGCPLGSHMRRGNARDGLATKLAQKGTLMRSSNRHRLLRRGRKYGPYIADRMVADGNERGLIFLAINTDIERQFEFVQQTWMMNPTFATLDGETDPLIGPPSPMSIANEPVRRKIEVASHVRMAGGDYFFLPSLPALDWLGGL